MSQLNHPFKTRVDNEKFACVSASIVFCLWLSLVYFQSFPDPQGTDFYPLWVGAQAIMNGSSPYAPSTFELLRTSWSVAKLVQVSDAIAYPFPVLVLITPLTILPLEVAVCLWFLLLLASVVVFVFAFECKKPISYLIPLLSFPLFQALTIKTSAVLWLGLIGLLHIAIKKNLVVSGGFCIALLPGKPQAGLIFAVAAVIWAFQNNRVVLTSASLWALILWGGATIIRPEWPIEWWQAVQIYRQQVPLVWLLPQAFVLPLFSRQLSWFAIAATAQVISFPINGLYSSLPLLVGWMEIGGWLALAAVSCSWLAPVIAKNPHHTFLLWLTILLPYCACALAHSFAKLKKAGNKEEISPVCAKNNT